VKRRHKQQKMDSTKLTTSESVSKKKGKTKNLKRKPKPGKAPVEKMDQAESEVTEEKPVSGACFPPTFSMSDIKNKQRRHSMFLKLKEQKRKVTSHRHNVTLLLI